MSGSDELGDRPGVTFMRVFIALLVVSLPAAFIAAASLKPKERIAVSVQGIDTKYTYRDEQSQAALVVITNSGPHTFDFHVALQTKESFGWNDPASIMSFYFDDGPSRLLPFGERRFHLPVPISPIPHPWRVVVSCTRESRNLNKSESFKSRMYSWFFPSDGYHYYFTSVEMPPNEPLKRL
jgi:hypothetical protein